MAEHETVTDLTKGVYRRLYSGFTKGQRINRLSLQAEAWFWRVLATVDDFGNGDADPELCRDNTVGRRRGITTKQISGWLREMRDAGLIQFYTVKGEPFLHVIGFESTQPAGKNGRRVKRFVTPDESEGIQDNPDVVSASYSDNHTDTYSDNNKAVAPPFSGNLFLSTLSDFEQHRKEIKKPLKPTGRSQLYRQLEQMGEVKAITAMKRSIASGWQGVFEENGNGTTQQHNGYETAAEKRGRNFRSQIDIVNQLRRESLGSDNEGEGGSNAVLGTG